MWLSAAHGAEGSKVDLIVWLIAKTMLVYGASRKGTLICYGVFVGAGYVR
jgi:hypothetical protein